MTLLERCAPTISDWEAMGGDQLADSMKFLEGQSQAGLQIANQKGPAIRTANDPTAS